VPFSPCDSSRFPKESYDRLLVAALSNIEMTTMNGGRFVTDAMLGKLTKWLRVMGIDVMYGRDIGDEQLLQYAASDGRVLLTRDRRLMRRRGQARRVFIESDYYHEQVRQVVQAFHLANRIEVFSRCIRCNTPLQTIAKEVVAGRVPSFIFATQMAFKHCTACERLYWGGTHRDNMLRQLQTMLGDLLPIDLGTPC
jgi:uncharacterized protein